MGAIERAINIMGAQSLFIMSGDGNDLPTERISEYIATLDIPVCGGIFPQIIHQQHTYERGNVVCAMDASTPIAVLKGLGTCTAHDVTTAIADHRGLNIAPSYMVLAAGASARIDTFIQQLGLILDPGKPVLGATAGSLDMPAKPCLITAEGIISDAAVVMGLHTPVSIGIGHGWQPATGPFIVTRSQDSEVVTLDHRPAFDVYRDAVEPLASLSFDHTDFTTIADRFPLAIDACDRHHVIQEPIQVSGGALLCTGHIPEHSTVYIAQGQAETVITAALEGAYAAHGDPQYALAERNTIIFSSIRRQQYLKEKFNAELAGLWAAAPAQPELIGALGMGQIARSPEGTLRVFHRAAVTGVSAGH